MIKEIDWLRGYKTFLKNRAKIIDEGVFKEIDERIKELEGDLK